EHWSKLRSEGAQFYTSAVCEAIPGKGARIAALGRSVSFNGFYFLFDQRRDAVPREINLTHAHSQLCSHFLRWPFFAHVAIEYLKLFRIDLLLHSGDRSVEQVFLPFPFPEHVKIDNV